MFVWMNGNSFTKVATISKNNITLNTHCIQYFENNNWCIVGIDANEKKVAIKSVSNDEIKKNKYSPTILNKVSIGKSYVRISNQSIILEISKVLKNKCNGEKYLVSFDEKEFQLIIELNNPFNK